MERMSKYAKDSVMDKNRTQLVGGEPRHSPHGHYHGSTAKRTSRPEDSRQTMYVTDSKGNLLRVSRSTIFDGQNEQHRMMPKLNHGSGTISSGDITAMDSVQEASRKTRLAVQMKESPEQARMKETTKTSYLTGSVGDKRGSYDEKRGS